MNAEYLFLLVSILAVCLAINLKYRLRIFESSKQAGIGLFSLFAIGSVLDSFAVTRGYWTYNITERFYVGIKIGVLPVEEYLFMLVIPYLTLTIYCLVRRKQEKDDLA